jgi:hypothetical protein
MPLAPCRVEGNKRYGRIEHLEISSIEPSRAQLQITETGYKSHYVQEEYLSEFSSPAEYVLAWLEHEAGQPEWLEYLLQANQYSLF